MHGNEKSKLKVRSIMKGLGLLHSFFKSWNCRMSWALSFLTKSMSEWHRFYIEMLNQHHSDARIRQFEPLFLINVFLIKNECIGDNHFIVDLVWVFVNRPFCLIVESTVLLYSGARRVMLLYMIDYWMAHVFNVHVDRWWRVRFK